MRLLRSHIDKEKAGQVHNTSPSTPCGHINTMTQAVISDNSMNYYHVIIDYVISYLVTFVNVQMISGKG